MVQKQPVLIAEVELLEDPEDDSAEVPCLLQSVLGDSCFAFANDAYLVMMQASGWVICVGLRNCRRRKRSQRKPRS